MRRITAIHRQPMVHRLDGHRRIIHIRRRRITIMGTPHRHITRITRRHIITQLRHRHIRYLGHIQRQLKVTLEAERVEGAKVKGEARAGTEDKTAKKATA